MNNMERDPLRGPYLAYRRPPKPAPGHMTLAHYVFWIVVAAVYVGLVCVEVFRPK